MRNVNAENSYFTSWRTHNWDTLKGITTEDIRYHIRGKRTINGHAELERYWSRNADRQDNLVVNQHFVDAGDAWSTYCFNSHFYNTRKRERQSVFGLLTFVFSDDGAIKEVSETYSKIVEDAPADRRSSIERFLQWVSSSPIKEKLKSTPRSLARLLVRFIRIALPVFVVLYFILELGSASSDFLTRLTLSEFWGQGQINASQLQTQREFLLKLSSGVLAASTVIYILLESASRWLEARASLRTFPIKDRSKDPARLMARHLSGAQNVSVFSGDFDFFEDNELLIDVFRHLASNGNLTFFSERSPVEIARETENLPRTNDIINRLSQAGRVFFNSNIKGARATLFEKEGVSHVLHLPNRDTFVVLSGIDENEAVIKMLKSLLHEKFGSQERGSVEKFHTQPKKPKVILVLGETFAGKTSLSRMLADDGFQYVSVSNVMREMSDEQLEGRQQLVDYGKKLMSEGQGDALYSALREKAFAGSPVVIDGLRPAVLVERFRAEFGKELLTVFVSISRSDQKSRFDRASSKGDEHMTLQQIRSSDDYFETYKAAGGSDVVLSGEAVVTRNYKKILEAWS